MSVENTILSNLICNEPYARKVIPFIRTDYFTDKNYQVVLDMITAHYFKFNSVPSKETLAIDLDGAGYNEQMFNDCKDIIENLSPDSSELEWAVDITEKFCEEKAVYNAIMGSIEILDNKNKDKTKTAIPEMLSDALAVSFDTHIGHDFVEDSEERFDSYHRKEEKVDFDIDLLNKITMGGFSKKSLNVILAGTGAGKSLAMCHFASHNLTQGKNVLYITLEMAEEAIARRIDSNLMDIRYDELELIPKDMYEKKMDKIASTTKGKLIIKEYPTATAHSLHFKALLKELELKRKFKPDIIYIDYINLCMSSRLKGNVTANSYTIVKAIAEELRGLAVTFGVPIVTATQTNRAGFADSDVGLENTSESFGLPATADFMFALIRSEELDTMDQVMIKQLKNRYADPAAFRRFVVGVDKTKFRLYDAEDQAQFELSQDAEDNLADQLTVNKLRTFSDFKV